MWIPASDKIIWRLKRGVEKSRNQEMKGKMFYFSPEKKTRIHKKKRKKKIPGTVKRSSCRVKTNQYQFAW